MALTVSLGAAWMVAGAQAQEYVLPEDRPEACSKVTPKMSLTQASFDPFRRTTSIFAPISTRASGLVHVELRGAGRITEFDLPIDSARGWIRGTRGIDTAQARAATAVLTLSYPGDADTRPQTLRLRAAVNPARLWSDRPRITPSGFLEASGTISGRARGSVRIHLEWVNRIDGSLGAVEVLAPVASGRWRVSSPLPPDSLDQIARRCSEVQSTVLFTGYQPLLMRGEVRSLRVLPAQ
jgi:hypothetical protein